MGNHRADPRAHSRGPSETPILAARSAGRRKAVKSPALRARRHTGSRGSLFRGLPSAPILLGVAALAISVGGAVTAADAGISNVASAQIRPRERPHRRQRRGPGQPARHPQRHASAATAGREAPVDDKMVAKAEKQAKQRNATLAQFAAQAEVQARKIARNQWVLPLVGYRLTATFGEYGLWSSLAHRPRLRRPQRHQHPRDRQRRDHLGRLRRRVRQQDRRSPSRTAPSCGSPTRRRTS